MVGVACMYLGEKPIIVPTKYHLMNMHESWTLLVVGRNGQKFASCAFGANGHATPKTGCLRQLSVAKGPGGGGGA